MKEFTQVFEGTEREMLAKVELLEKDGWKATNHFEEVMDHQGIVKLVQTLVRETPDN